MGLIDRFTLRNQIDWTKYTALERHALRDWEHKLSVEYKFRSNWWPWKLSIHNLLTCIGRLMIVSEHQQEDQMGCWRNQIILRVQKRHSMAPGSQQSVGKYQPEWVPSVCFSLQNDPYLVEREESKGYCLLILGEENHSSEVNALASGLTRDQMPSFKEKEQRLFWLLKEKWAPSEIRPRAPQLRDFQLDAPRLLPTCQCGSAWIHGPSLTVLRLSSGSHVPGPGDH